MSKLNLIALAVSATLLTACSNDAANDAPAEEQKAAVEAQVAETTQETAAAEQEMTESEKANAMFEEMFMTAVMRSPIFQTFLGIKKDYDKWGDFSEARAAEDHEIDKQNLAKLKTISGGITTTH